MLGEIHEYHEFVHAREDQKMSRITFSWIYVLKWQILLRENVNFTLQKNENGHKIYDVQQFKNESRHILTWSNVSHNSVKLLQIFYNWIYIYIMSFFGPIFDDRLKEKFLKPCKDVLCIHFHVRVFVCKRATDHSL